MRYKATFLYSNLFALLLLINTCFCLKADSSPQSDKVPASDNPLSRPLIVRWRYQQAFTTRLTPVTKDDRIYFPLSSGKLIALKAEDGQLLWKTELGGELSADPITDDRGVYVASEIDSPTGAGDKTGALRAVGREGGITLWMKTFPKPIQGSLASNNLFLYGGSGDGRVYAIKKSTGDIAWIMQHSAAFAARPTLYNKRLYIGSNDGLLFSLDQDTGEAYWRYQTRGAIQGRAIVVNGTVFFGSADGYIYAIRESDGHLRWRRRTGASVQTVSYAQAGLIVSSLDNFVYCLSFSKGNRLWKRQLGGRLTTEPLIVGDEALFTPFSTSTGVVLDLHDGKQLNSLPIGEDNDATASPIVAGDFLFLTTRQGILAFSAP